MNILVSRQDVQAAIDQFGRMRFERIKKGCSAKKYEKKCQRIRDEGELLWQSIELVENIMYIDLLLEDIQQKIDFYEENKTFLNDYQRGKMEAHLEDMQTIRRYYMKKKGVE